MFDTLLFDLDGTLLPIDQETFTKAYFAELAQTIAPLGYEKEPFLDAVWQGTIAMAGGNGKETNRERFWDSFARSLGRDARALEPTLLSFYTQEFDRVGALVPAGYSVRDKLDALHASGYTLALATSPFFPEAATQTRLSWIGADCRDFAYITSYENSHFPKPRREYFQEIFTALHKRPGACLMVGNHASEDIVPAKLGAGVFLLTDHLENPGLTDLSAVPHGGWADLFSFLAADRGE